MGGISWTLVIVMHLALTMATAAGSEAGQCDGNIPSWACDAPFEPFFAAFSGGFSIGAFLKGGFGLIGSIFGLLFFDYPILRQEGLITGFVGFSIRIIGFITSAIAITGTLFSIIRR